MTEPQFKDVEFMTATEKALVLKQWKVFVANGFQLKHFTKRLYQHLTLHCSFIAHYNLHGFYSVYFEDDKESTKRFIRQFTTGTSAEMGMSYWMDGDYDDLNPAMCEVMKDHADAHLSRLSGDIKDRDLALAQGLARKHGFKLALL
jgi:hypothetical protein